jgi:hypothetical protein
MVTEITLFGLSLCILCPGTRGLPHFNGGNSDAVPEVIIRVNGIGEILIESFLQVEENIAGEDFGGRVF